MDSLGSFKSRGRLLDALEGYLNILRRKLLYQLVTKKWCLTVNYIKYLDGDHCPQCEFVNDQINNKV